MYRATAIRTMLTGEQQTGGMEPRLVAVDRILQRWVVSIAGGLASEVWDDTPAARPPPLDEECAVIIDQMVLHAPKRKRRVINCWYRKPWPTRLIARKLAVSERGLYLELRASLDYIRLQILATDQRTLKEMLKMRGE